MTQPHAETVNQWFQDHLRIGPIAQHTPAYNQLVAALPALIAALDGPSAPIAKANAVRTKAKSKPQKELEAAAPLEADQVAIAPDV